MKSIAEFLLSYESFRAALVALGWSPPVETKGGGGPGPQQPK